MLVLPTLAILGIFIAALVLLRFRWPAFSAQSQRFMIIVACVIPAITGIAAITKWISTSPCVNAAVYLAFLLSYSFFVILFTRLRPRWLTTIIAIILIAPLLSASVFLPVGRLIKASTVTRSLGDGFFSELAPWGSGNTQTSGTDLTIYYRSAWMPFLQRSQLSSRYYGGQCNAWAAYAVLQPDHKSALMVCPPWPGEPEELSHRGVWRFK
jgi:hypothetical protein